MNISAAVLHIWKGFSGTHVMSCYFILHAMLMSLEDNKHQWLLTSLHIYVSLLCDMHSQLFHQKKTKRKKQLFNYTIGHDMY